MASESKDGNNGTLIISPQAGFGNRIRALASGIALAKYHLNKTPVFVWEEYKCKTYVQVEHFSDYFEPMFVDGSCPKTTLACDVPSSRSWSDQPVAAPPRRDVEHCVGCTEEEVAYLPTTADMVQQYPQASRVVTEWVQGDGWWPVQSAAQRCYPSSSTQPVVIHKVDPFTGMYPASDSDAYPVEILETSKRITNVTDAEMTAVYTRYFRPHARFLSYINHTLQLESQPVHIGIHIRRGDLLRDVPEARQNVPDIAIWLWGKILARYYRQHQPVRIVVFSDDKDVRQDMKNRLCTFAATSPSSSPMLHIVEHRFVGESWEIAFVEFLILSRCAFVYGTPGSSFSEEAALFGGLHNSVYQKILSL